MYCEMYRVGYTCNHYSVSSLHFMGHTGANYCEVTVANGMDLSRLYLGQYCDSICLSVCIAIDAHGLAKSCCLSVHLSLSLQNKTLFTTWQFAMSHYRLLLVSFILSLRMGE